MKIILLLFILNFTLHAQDTIGPKKSYVSFHVYKGIADVKPYIIYGLTEELKSTLKVHNDLIKSASQTDSLIVFFGVTYSYPYKYSENKIRVPNHYYRLIVSLTTHNVISSVLFDNSSEPTAKKITVAELEHECKFFFKLKLGYTIHEKQ